LSKITNQYDPLKNRLNSILIELNDIQSDLNNSNFDFSDNSFEIKNIEDRINLIYSLQKKHNLSSVEDLIEKKKKLKNKLDDSSNLETDIKDFELQIETKKSFLEELSKKISISRKKILPLLKSDLESLLGNLGMKNSSFNFILSKSKEFNRFGFDDIEVLFSANKGITHSPLFKVASGGELSRILLSIKYIMSKNLNLPTMIFDEIDTGVSGEMSNAMANMMLKMSDKMQIVAITHLPQVAAKGTQQLKVYKTNYLNTTNTDVKLLSSGERVDEIAKMLSGDEISDSALNHAKELLN
jgi:DNA repair protein RecN (Recombination protein N)